MKICLIGQNLTNLVLAVALARKKISVDLYVNKKNIDFKTNRTIAISAENLEYLKFLINYKFSTWKTKEIKIYTKDLKSREIINFKKKNKEAFNLITYTKLYNVFLKKLYKINNIKLIKTNTSSLTFVKALKRYDLVINSENKNIISQKFFYNKIRKDYKSTAYTFLIDHKKKINNIASQIFTKHGTIAFLPLSNVKTSIVISYLGPMKSENEIIKIFNNYNSLYNTKKMSKVEKFELVFSMLRNYTKKNILAFGDLIHRIHPLAGQGFNMTIRDIKIICSIVEHKISLGLPIDFSVAEDFSKSTKHLNYLYGKAIDGIYEFFSLDNKLNNSISKPVFKILNNNSIFKKYSDILSDKGFNI